MNKLILIIMGIALFGTACPGGGSDEDADGYTADAGDCNDLDASTYPGATELCDGRDNNCNGRVDEDCEGDTDTDTDTDSDTDTDTDIDGGTENWIFGGTLIRNSPNSEGYTGVNFMVDIATGSGGEETAGTEMCRYEWPTTATHADTPGANCSGCDFSLPTVNQLYTTRVGDYCDDWYPDPTYDMGLPFHLGYWDNYDNGIDPPGPTLMLYYSSADGGPAWVPHRVGADAFTVASFDGITFEWQLLAGTYAYY